MTREYDWPERFWTVMLPLCWVLSPLLALLAHWQMNAAGVTGAGVSKSFQSALFMSVFLGMFGLMAMRILIGRAIDEARPSRAIVLGAVSLVCSITLIGYGLSTIG